MLPPYRHSFKKDVPYLAHDWAEIKRVFPNWLSDLSGYSLSDKYKQPKKPDLEQTVIDNFPRRCYLLSPGTTWMLALIAPLTEHEADWLSHTESKAKPKYHYHLNNLVEGYHDEESYFEEMIELMLVNPSYWLFNGGELERCRLINQFGLVGLLETFQDKNLLSIKEWLTKDGWEL